MVVRWNLLDSEQGKVIAKVPTSIYAINYDSERNLLIVGQNYEGIHLIDLENERERGSVKVGTAAIFDIQVHGKYLWVTTGEGEILIIDYDRLIIKQRLQPTQQRARSMDFNPETEELAVGFSDHTIRIYDATSHQQKQIFREHTNSVFAVRYSSDYRFLITGGRDAHLKVWDVRKNYQLTESIVAHMYAINSIHFSDNGEYFATGSMDKSIKVWDANQFRLLKVIDQARHAGHGTSVNRVLWLPASGSENHHRLISASDDRTVSVWKLREATIE